RLHDLVAAQPQPLGQPLGLGGFARALAALKCDEPALMPHLGLILQDLVDAAPDPAAGQLRGAVEGALDERSFSDVGGGVKWHFERDVVAACDAQARNLLAPGDGCDYGPPIMHAGHEFVATAARAEQVDRAFADDRDIAAVPAKHADLGDIVALGKQAARLKVA